MRINSIIKFLLGSTTGDECRIIIFEEPLPNKAINGHVIRSEEVANEGDCRMMCYMEPNCVSVNLRPLHGGKYKCELNNATVDESKLTFLEEMGAYYLAIEVMFIKIKLLFIERAAIRIRFCF